MKKINLICLAALILSACLSEKELDTAPETRIAPGKITITATIGEGTGTKLYLEEDTGKLFWEGDEDPIGVFTGNPEDTGAAFAMEESSSASTATFTGELKYPVGEYLYGIHPYTGSEYNHLCGMVDGKIRLPLLNGFDVYDFQDGKIFGYETRPHLLPREGITFPMVARSQDTHFHFYNVCGGLKVVVDNPNLMGVVIKNNDGNPLWGIMEISFDADGKPVMESLSITDELIEAVGEGGEYNYHTPDEFWIMDDGSNGDYRLDPGEPYYALLPPITFTQGMTVTFRTPSTYATYNVNKSFSIERSVFSRLTLRDKGLEFKPIEGNLVFESEGFKQYCVNNFDTNHDGEISFAEALAVKEILINGTASTDAPGLEDLMFFENLEKLVCRGTSDNPGSLRSLETPWLPKLKYLDCSYNNIQNEVDLSSNPDIETVNLQYNQISGINVKNCSKLNTLALTDNKVTEIDLSDCPVLDRLYLSGNDLNSLDVSHNPLLTYINCNYNKNIGSLDLSNNPLLETLYGGGCGLSTLDVSKQPRLITLYCWGNNLTSLDISNNENISFLSCYNNNLTSLNLTHLKYLIRAFVSYNPLGSLDVTKNPNLEILYCCLNELKTLDVSNNPKLQYLRFFDNDITGIDLSQNPDLTEVVFGGNPLELLDVSHNPKLYYFDGVYEEPLWRNGELVSDVKYNTFTSPLKYLIIADGQSIPEVTYDRIDQTIPYATIVLTRAQYESGVHPHADLFGDYTMKAYHAKSNDEYSYDEWTSSISEYASDPTRATLSWFLYLAQQNQASFSPSIDIYGIVAGDRSRIRIPLPQQTPCYWENASSDWSMFLWDGELMSGRFTANEGVVTFTRQGDGSYKADKPFGLAFTQGSYGIDYYSQGLYFGQVNLSTDEYPIVLIKQ